MEAAAPYIGIGLAILGILVTLWLTDRANSQNRRSFSKLQADLAITQKEMQDTLTRQGELEGGLRELRLQMGDMDQNMARMSDDMDRVRQNVAAATKTLDRLIDDG